MKGAILIAAVVAAVALGACRREEPAPLKLGADVHAEVAMRPGRHGAVAGELRGRLVLVIGAASEASAQNGDGGQLDGACKPG